MTIRWLPTRREWLASAAGAALALIPLGALASASGRPQASAAERWLAQLRTPASAAVVGREYLRSAPRESTRERLRADLDAAIGTDALSDAEIRRRVSARVRQDYAAGDTVRLRGWILSRTEARLCALAALS
jgi:hypothetical protein